MLAPMWPGAISTPDFVAWRFDLTTLTARSNGEPTKICSGGDSGIRTPDLRIMIPSL